jgi:hypothetical protein
MSIIQLEANLLVHLANVAVMQVLVTIYGSTNAGGDEEVLLLQTQFLTGIVVIVGVQNLYDVLSQVLLLNGLLVVALIEVLQAKGVDRLSIPDTQGVYYVVAVTDDRQIVGNSQYRLVVLLNVLITALVIDDVLDVTTELYFVGVLITTHLERIAML